MLLGFDIGNTTISLGVFQIENNKPNILFSACIASHPRRTSDEYCILVNNILLLHNVSVADIHAAAISAVVPELLKPIHDTAKFFSHNEPFIVGPGIRTALNIRIDQQSQLGADIVCNAVAALQLIHSPAVIADFGTATTFTVIESNSVLSGTIICPGLRISQTALSDSASLLVSSELTRPKELIGKNTRDSIDSGLINGHILMTDGFIRELRQTLISGSENKLSLIATGGFSGFIAPHCRNKFQIVPDLTLKGLAEIYVKNR